MPRKKTVKKTTKKVAKKKTIRKPRVVKKPIIPKKPEQEVMKRLDQEVKKPGLGEIKGVRDKRFIPQREQRFVRRPGFQNRRFGERRFQSDSRFKSHGERQISQFLKEERIHFLYEYPLAITDEDRKVRIWYPDFWLPELNIIIEYMGMKGKGDYDKANMRKKKIYNALKIDFIEITPGLLVKGNWKRFIAMKIISIMRSKSYMYNKMKTLSQKYRIPAEDRDRDVGLEVLD